MIRILLDKTIEISLFFIFSFTPLIVNPTAYDYFFKPKIESVYALILIISLSWFIRDGFMVRSCVWRKNPLSIPLLIYGIVCIVSTFMSIDRELSLRGDILREEGLFTLLSYIALVFIMGNVVRDRALGMRLLKGLAFSTGLLSLYGLVQYFGYNPTAHFLFKTSPGKISSTMGNPNFLGKYLVLTIPLLFSLYLQSNYLFQNIFLALGTTLAFSCLILTYSRGSWVGFAFDCIIFIFLLMRYRIEQWVKRFLIISLLFFLAIIFFNMYRPKVEGLSTPEGEGLIVHRVLSSSEVGGGMGVATRLFVWQKALILIAQRPWFGHGPETFEKAFRRYNLEYAKKFNDYVRVDRAHNNYLDLAFSVGILGLCAYLSILLVFFIILFRSIKANRTRGGRLIYIGIISGSIGYLINDIFIFSAVSVSPTFWSLIGLSLVFEKDNT